MRYLHLYESSQEYGKHENFNSFCVENIIIVLDLTLFFIGCNQSSQWNFRLNYKQVIDLISFILILPVCNSMLLSRHCFYIMFSFLFFVKQCHINRS